jgi:hypothetical protein
MNCAQGPPSEVRRGLSAVVLCFGGCAFASLALYLWLHGTDDLYLFLLPGCISTCIVLVIVRSLVRDESQSCRVATLQTKGVPPIVGGHRYYGIGIVIALALLLSHFAGWYLLASPAEPPADILAVVLTDVSMFLLIRRGLRICCAMQ